MLFNSYPFMFVFLPLALAGYAVAGRFHRKAVILWLGLISLVFYGWWQPSLLIILAGSIFLNYVASALISRQIPNRVDPRSWLYLALAFNLMLLGYYKYFFPSLNSLSSAFGLSKHWTNVALPLGISFFTFTQIAFLIDLYNKRAEQQDLPSYLLFVSFFPHLIAGPILHHREMMPQFKRDSYRLNLSDLTVGGTWFVLGLAKKVLIADTFAKTVNPIFGARATLPASVAWVGALAYTMQLYFDFSGYSDMALGLARMFSIDFPLNFNSPFKASSILGVWPRWHMTLGRYIFTYIYNPLQRQVLAHRMRQGRGISRQDRAKVGVFLRVVVLPLMVTMFLAGIWHGAGLQFVVFGLLHGFYLSVNYGWRQLRKRPAAKESVAPPMSKWVRRVPSAMLTLLCVVVSLVFFRSNSVGHAVSILASMFGVHHAAALPGFRLARPVVTILAGFVIVWCFPNTQQILTRFRPSLQKTAWDQEEVPRVLRWSPTAGWAVAVGVLFFVVLVELQQPATFLYFQF